MYSCNHTLQCKCSYVQDTQFSFTVVGPFLWYSITLHGIVHRGRSCTTAKELGQTPANTDSEMRTEHVGMYMHI